MRKNLLLLLLLSSVSVYGEVLDKIAGVFEDKIFSLSEIKRVKVNLKARNNISPQIFGSTSLTNKQIANILINSEIIKKRLEEIGYIISDEQVESQIRSTEKRLQLSRDQLAKFIENNGLKFTEYFEIIRQTIEYNIFLQRVISPLVSITDQEIVAEFKRQFPGEKAQSFVYDLVDFKLPRFKKTKKNLRNVKKSIAKYIKFNNKDQFLEKAEVTQLDDIEEEGLNAEMKKTIKNTTVKALSKPVYLGGVPHIFHVKSRKVTYSEQFLAKKNMLKNMIAQKEIGKVVKIWLEREGRKYYKRILL